MYKLLGALLHLTIPLTASAAEVMLAEKLPAATSVRLNVEVQIEGTLNLSAVAGTAARTMKVSGTSKLAYDERSLPAEDDAARLIRIYRTVEIARTADGKPQKAEIRPSVRRMIVLRNEKAKSPFSPDGPLTLAEIDVVKNDLFAPMLANGLLSGKAAKPGDTWKANAEAVRELTDLASVSEGSIEIKFVGVVNFNGKDRARLQLSGTVKGVDDNGPARHTLDGTAYFDLDTTHLSYLIIKGTHELLDGEGKAAGRIDGRFTMTRTPKAVEELTDRAIEKVELKPNAANTRLLYENAEFGLRLVHPRRFRVGVVQGQQLTLNGPNRAGILITMETAKSLPTADALLRETLEFLAKDKAKTANLSQPKRIKHDSLKIDRFGLDATIGMDEVRLEYAVIAKAQGGATIAARFAKADAEVLTGDLEVVLESLKLAK